MKQSETSLEDDRISELEAVVAHLERNYDAINATVVAQGKLIARLQKRLEQLDETLNTQNTERLPAQNTKPPHYGR